MTNAECMVPPRTACQPLSLPAMMSLPPRSFCVDPDGIRFCCIGPGDCPAREGVVACLGATDTLGIPGLCIYGDEVPMACLAALRGSMTPGELLRACFTPPAAPGTPSSSTVPFRDGNCDRDARRNGGDPCPCDPLNACARADAGIPELDAGTVEDDAGTVDLGTVPTPFDASVARGPEFRGGGGCACHVTHGGRAAHARFAALSGALLLLLRARRRRAR